MKFTESIKRRLRATAVALAALAGLCFLSVFLVEEAASKQLAIYVGTVPAALAVLILCSIDLRRLRLRHDEWVRISDERRQVRLHFALYGEVPEGLEHHRRWAERNCRVYSRYLGGGVLPPH